jgi:hypothetical protein
MRKEITHSQRFFIALSYLVTGNNLEDLKFMRVTSQSTGINVPETCLLQTETK